MTTNDLHVTPADTNGNPTSPAGPVTRFLRAWVAAYVGMYERYYVSTNPADGSARLRWAPTV